MSTSPRRLGKYELQRRLGRGGMAEVWKALDTQLQRDVAIKFLHADLRTDPDFMTRFVREAQVIASLRHPNIVRLHDFHASDPSDPSKHVEEEVLAYMVMDYIEGMTLAEYIRGTSRIGAFPAPAEILHLFTAIGSAIDYAHRRGILHRDIKPANILLDTRRPSRYQMGEPVLIDLGIVKVLGASTNTAIGWVGGTPSYISPEQAQALPTSERSDIYSLGVVLYEICTGVRPFQGDNASVIMMHHITMLPTPPILINPHLPSALSDVILQSLAKNPADRFPSASAMAAKMAAAFDMTTPIHLLSDTPNSATGPIRTPSQPGLPTSLTSSSLSSQSASPPSSHIMAPLTPQFERSASWSPVNSEQHYPMASMGATPKGISSETSSHMLAQASSSFPVASPSRPTATRKRRAILFLSLALLFLVVASAVLGTVYIRSRTSSLAIPTAVTGSQSVGQVFFVNSDLGNGQVDQGVEDELQMNLSNIREPASGKHYYAWLLSDTATTPMTALLLGPSPLVVNKGNAQFSYHGVTQHANLLATYSRFLITQDSTPTQPSNDHSTWRYYAVLPQAPADTANHASALDALRSLLCETHDFSLHGPLRGGMMGPYLKTAKQILDLANTLSSSWNSKDYTSIQQQSVRILDYLDSVRLVSVDVPAGTPILVDTASALTPMINVTRDNAVYSQRIGDELTTFTQAPGVTPHMQKLANNAYNALINVYTWLSKVHDDAKQLANMSTAQLQQSSTLDILQDLATQADYAYNGQADPSTNTSQSGLAWINQNIQALSTFDVQPYR